MLIILLYINILIKYYFYDFIRYAQLNSINKSRISCVIHSFHNLILIFDKTHGICLREIGYFSITFYFIILIKNKNIFKHLFKC